MKPVIRYQSQLLPRRSYKPSRVIRIRSVKVRFDFRPVRFGIKPTITFIDQPEPGNSALALAGIAPKQQRPPIPWQDDSSPAGYRVLGRP
jgi:hypothetical protein